MVVPVGNTVGYPIINLPISLSYYGMNGITPAYIRAFPLCDTRPITVRNLQKSIGGPESLLVPNSM
jgi:hypothetical protein